MIGGNREFFIEMHVVSIRPIDTEKRADNKGGFSFSLHSYREVTTPNGNLYISLTRFKKTNSLLVELDRAETKVDEFLLGDQKSILKSPIRYSPFLSVNLSIANTHFYPH
eukprot:231381_1